MVTLDLRKLSYYHRLKIAVASRGGKRFDLEAVVVGGGSLSVQYYRSLAGNFLIAALTRVPPVLPMFIDQSADASTASGAYVCHPTGSATW